MKWHPKKYGKLLTSADNTNNQYEVTTYEYKNLLTENISKADEYPTFSSMHNINTGAKVFAQDLKIEERIEDTSKSNILLR